MQNRFKIVGLALCAGLTFLGQTSFAADNNEYRRWNNYNTRTQEKITISTADRQAIQKYYKDFYQRNCQGKRTRKNDCLPPGLYKKYTVGKPLAENVVTANLPQALINTLRPLNGYEYVKIDKDIVLISTQTGTVMDAVATGTTISYLLPIDHSYVVYFDSNASTLRKGENRIFDQIAREITQYDPRQVTVTSLADSIVTPTAEEPITDERAQALFTVLQQFGLNIKDPTQVTTNNTAVVNKLEDIATLQEKTVSAALAKRNIPNQIVDSEVRGSLKTDYESEENSEIEETQMVIIDFRK